LKLGGAVMATPGIGDPYWYEWYVGLEQIIKMMNPDIGISYVTFQSDVHNTIDDVVVGYKDKQEVCFQVKHEVGNVGRSNLTFSKLIETTSGNNGKVKESLINELAKGWKEAEKLEGKEIIPVLYTNRGLGVNRQSRNYCGEEYKALPLTKFIEQIQLILNQNITFDNLYDQIKEKNLKLQWLELKSAIGENDENVLRFVKALKIRSNEGSLDDLETNMLEALQKVFNCEYVIAKNLFDKLCSNLRIWTTTRREKVRVTLEDVFNVLAIDNDVEHGEHKLPYPNPFFESRKNFCDNLICKIKSTDKKVVFISGEPGSGKTSLISYLQLKHNLFTARYHTFKPISPEQKFYNADEGLCKPESLWNDLLIQLRSYFKNQLHKYNIPVVNALCSVEQMRGDVLRLSELLYKKTNVKTILCIDGIDHAARSSMVVTLLNSLFKPTEIPEGVCLVIVGQPADMYDKYPLWIKNNTLYVEQFTVPPLTIEDIKALILDKNFDNSININILAEFIFAKTKGNNLSVVFAIEESKNCKNIDELSEILDEKHINVDITNYYNYIWKHVSNRLNTMGTGFPFPDTVVASAIILLNGRLNPLLLSEAIKINFLEEDWEELLNSLYPLIQKLENQKEYAIFHNDFRVFLMAAINRDSSKYKKIALQLAEYYMTQDQGIDRIVNIIPLLLSAEREDLIAKVFDSSFVIHSLAEGISRSQINEYASLAYKSSIVSRNWSIFHSVYLAINTLKQHYRYFEYYDRKYELIDKSYTGVLQGFEMNVSPLTLDNLEDYLNMLNFCQDLIDYKDQISYLRAKSTFYLWMEHLTPPTFIRTLKKIQAEFGGIWDTNVVQDIIKSWGRLSAIFGCDYVNLNLADFSAEEINASMDFNDIYFEYLLKNNEIEKSNELINNFGVSYRCIQDNLQNILFKDNTREFKKIFEPLIKRNHNFNSKLLAMVCFIDSGKNINLDSFISNTDIKPITYITDETSFTIILWSVVKGYHQWNIDASIVVGELYRLIENIERKNRDFDYLKTLIRHGVLLGQTKKCNEKANQLSDIKILLKSYEDFFIGEIHKIRTFDFKDGFSLLLYLSLKEEWANKSINDDKLTELVENHLFNRNQLGMYYKTIILDYLLKNNNHEIVKLYINKLYGPHGSNLFQGSSFDETHNHFKYYGGLVLPELMNEVTNKLKWDVVGYVDHKEYALWPLLEYYKKISLTNPTQWKYRGIELYKLSYIADIKGSNRSSYGIQKAIANSAAMCGFEEMWLFRQKDRELRFSLDLLYQQILTLINDAKNLDEILTLWYLSCGILSWYNQDDRLGLSHIYHECINRSQQLRIVNIDKIFDERSRSQTQIANYGKHFDYTEKKDEYSIKRQEEKTVLQEKMSKLSNSEIIEILEFESFDLYKWTAIELGWDIVFERGTMSEGFANKIFEIVITKLEYYTWENSGCSTLVGKIIKYLGSNIAWELAKFNQINLTASDHFYTCTSNINSIFQWISMEVDIDTLQKFFDKELGAQIDWITGCGNLVEDFNYYEESICNLPIPKSIQQFALNVLIEQFETRNAHRIEISLQGIQLLAEQNPELFDFIENSWLVYNSNQKEFLIKLSERWSQQNIKGFSKLIPLIEMEFYNTNELDKLIQLYLILRNYNKVLDRKTEQIQYSAKAIGYNIPEQIPKIVDNSTIKKSIRHFLLAMESYSFNNNDIKYLLKNLSGNKGTEKKRNLKGFSRQGDSLLFPLDYLRGESQILYGEDKKGRWKYAPTSVKAQSLLSMDDAWIISEMPIVSNSVVWNIEQDLKKHLKHNTLTNSKILFEKIVHENIKDSQSVIGACVWYPIGYTDGFIYSESSKVISNQTLIKDRSITHSLNPGSIMVHMDELIEIEYEDVYENGVCLTNSIVGSSSFIYGNCMMYPSTYIRELLEIKPKKYNPLIWIDKEGNEVLYFERYVYPFRELLQESYFRQPLLSRWVCNKELISRVAKEKNLTHYSTNKIERMPVLG
jgi:hypothetical protein